MNMINVIISGNPILCPIAFENKKTEAMSVSIKAKKCVKALPGSFNLSINLIMITPFDNKMI